MIQLIIEESLDLITYLIRNYKDGNNALTNSRLRFFSFFSIFYLLLKNINQHILLQTSLYIIVPIVEKKSAPSPNRIVQIYSRVIYFCAERM